MTVLSTPVEHTLSIEHLTVDFGSQRAVDDVSLEFPVGTVHALLGANGSGKSTLIKALSGVVSPRASLTVRLAGHTVSGGLSPMAARQLGLRFVHQDLALLPDQSVLENLYLSNAYPTTLGQIRWGAARREVVATLERVGLAIDPRTPLREISHAQRVLIAVARALMHLPASGGYLFIDEPTAALDEAESDQLLTSVRALATDAAVGVVLVTHRLREVLRFTDGMTVLRDGRVAYQAGPGTPDVERHLLDALGAQGAGHRARPRTGTAGKEPAARPSAPAGTAPALVLSGVTGARVDNVNLLVGAGEIVGITGLEGSGKEELFRLLTGAQQPASGTITTLGSSEPTRRASEVLDLGVGIVPGDRLNEGGIGDLTVAENLFLPRFKDFKRHGLFEARRLNARAGEELVRYGVEPPAPARRFGSMSGGNQQKTIMARWLTHQPRLLLVQEPTAGVDIGSRQRIYAELRQAVADGMSIIVVSSDVAELAELCDRVAVMVDGRIDAELSGSYLTEENLALANFARFDDPGGLDDR